MKTLYLVRHAKSSWKNNLEDHQRPLKKRGINDTALVCKALKNEFSIPDLIVSSTAVRAKTTAQLFIDHLELQNINVSLEKNLYDFSGSELLNVIQNCDNTVNKLMVFGHNYAITNVVNTYGSKMIDNVPTCGYVEINFDTDTWGKLKKGTTIKTVFPKDLK